MTNLTDNIRQRIAKVQELVARGGTEGEKTAARAALDRLVKTHNLSEDALVNIELAPRFFNYKWKPEQQLFWRIIRHVVGNESAADQIKSTDWCPDRPLVRGKYLRVLLNYADYVIASCAYEYFRRHMKAQWDKHTKTELSRCRKEKTRRQKRISLEPAFLNRYILASGLYHESDITRVEHKGKEAEAHRRFRDVEGGQYKTQVERSGYFLES